MYTKRAIGLAARRGRVANWTSALDESMLRILKLEHTLGNCNGRHFMRDAWARIVPAFNRQTGLTLTKDNMQSRMGVLRQTFRLYNELATTRGWHWDSVKHLPIPREDSDWDKMIASNPCYAKCKNRPFPAYADIKFLFEKITNTLRQEDAVNGYSNISFSASNNDDNTHRSAINQNGGLVSPNKQTSSSSSFLMKRKTIKVNSHALDELTELGKQKPESAKLLFNQQVASKHKIYSISECISKLETVDGITQLHFLLFVRLSRMKQIGLFLCTSKNQLSGCGLKDRL